MDKNLVIEALKQVLANTYLLYFKTQNYHWNVDGPYFYSYHKMFEEQYQEVEGALDKIAELIRAAGEKVPNSAILFADYATIEKKFAESDAMAMVKDLYSCHQGMINSLTNLQKISSGGVDIVVENFAVERMYVHNKTLWMLKATFS